MIPANQQERVKGLVRSGEEEERKKKKEKRKRKRKNNSDSTPRETPGKLVWVG